jgi:hypothetical protein
VDGDGRRRWRNFLHETEVRIGLVHQQRPHPHEGRSFGAPDLLLQSRHCVHWFSMDFPN